ncbi:hypothetical protein ACFSTA_12230 [Ornithinibacillus salinisoli]|uniref:DUF3919 family protein n=1 Tax=Ornithinibacillus salinisoli TaxID=1848459 RepID=A0ABW4W2Y6_9BACI
MKKKTITLLLFSLVTAIGVLYVLNINSVQVITYFPPDEELSFVDASTTLTYIPEDNQGYSIDWTTFSNIEKDIYLRQDVSLLFSNGNLVGVQSKWEQNKDRIEISRDLQNNADAIWESISFHHGEIHYPENTIKSIQQMTFDNLYVYQENRYHAFKSASNRLEENVAESLDKKKNKQLLKHWQQLLSHFSIDLERYHTIPLTELNKYSMENLPGFNQEQTNKIIGQLWEGLYKNYILPAADSKQGKLQSYTPLVLLDKQLNQLLVVFELNGSKEKLIQNITQK